jgi:hypothetical protein
MKVITSVVLAQAQGNNALRIENRMEYWKNAHSKAEAEGFAVRSALEHNNGFQVHTVGSMITEE